LSARDLVLDRVQREPWLRLPPHRDRHLKAQIVMPGWRSALDFTALAALIWR
jgi:hypothetical protein